MPDPTNLEQLQEQKAQESHDAVKAHALRQTLSVFDPWYVTQGQSYLTLVERLQTVLQAEWTGQGMRPTALPMSHPD